MESLSDLVAAWDPTVHPPEDDWIFDELSFMRWMAQRDADEAYEHWCDRRGPEAFAAYRAAQDRADAAQDELAGWADAAHEELARWARASRSLAAG
jgi:hypothetical protein